MQQDITPPQRSNVVNVHMVHGDASAGHELIR